MSPRSSEFMEKARQRLLVARYELDAGFAAPSVSSAYYAMLYAARAALSEQDVYSKTHGGAWRLFGLHFVQQGRIDRIHASHAGQAQEMRWRADYEAEDFEPAEADELLQRADDFVAAVEKLLA